MRGDPIYIPGVPVIVRQLKMMTSPLQHPSSCKSLARGSMDLQQRRLGYLSLSKLCRAPAKPATILFFTNLAVNTVQTHYLECLALFVISVVFHMNFFPECGGYINDGESCCFNSNTVPQ